MPGHGNRPNSYRVGGTGLVVFDDQMWVTQHPAADTKIFAHQRRTQIGGPVPTALAQLRRFDVACDFCGSWSDDPAGRAIEANLVAEAIGFDTAVCRTATSSGIAHVWVEEPTGRRTVVALRPDGVPTVAAATAFGAGVDLLHLDGWGGAAAVAAARACCAAGGMVTLDAGSPKPATTALMPLVGVLNAPRRFLRSYLQTDDIAAGAVQLLAAGPSLVTITDGPHGAGIFTADESHWLPAFAVAAVDTCGAGDVFCGGLIAAVLADLPPRDALRFAMATAALKVAQPGNRAALPTRAQVETYLNSTL